MRYLPLTPDDRSEMLARIGVADIDALFADIPSDKRLKLINGEVRLMASLPFLSCVARVSNFSG